MLTVILAGGKGTRILEETELMPKAMVKIGDRPIIEHIMGCYEEQGFNEFLILAGYKGKKIFDYFKTKKNVTFLKEQGDCMIVELSNSKVTVLDTGEETGSAARLRIAKPYINEERFMLTYCDGLCSVNFNSLLNFHKEHGGMVTLTAVRPEPRFGILEIMEDGKVKVLKEKERKDSPIINGGFMVIESEIFNYLTEEMEHLEKDVLVPLSENGKLMAFYHDGFWQCMDTLQEKKYLCALWETRKAPWVNKKKD